MDFQEEIVALGRKSKQFGERFKKDQINEELTKNALIMPFIRALGYDIFDPMEVVPEYSAAIGEYKDARVDYAILSEEGNPIIIFECKAYGSELDAKKCNQLMWYFHGTEAKVAILTDGNRYQFYSDLEEQNKMDSKPYMELVLEKLDPTIIPELKKLAKGTFNVEDAMTSASVMKYTREFKRVMGEQLNAPDEDFLRFFLRQCYDGQITQSVRERFTPILKDALNLFIKDKINERLQNALDQEQVKAQKEEDTDLENTNEADDQEVITTDDEKQAYYIVKSILVGAGVDPELILLKDYKLFCNITYKNSYNIILRLYFNKEPYKVSFVIKDENGKKSEEKIDIANLSEIYKLADRIKQVAKIYEQNA